MSRRVKAPHEVDLPAFFAGVDEVRALLDDQAQSPAQRHERLLRLAAELARPRDVAAWCDWLCRRLSEAVGATATEVWLRGDDLESNKDRPGWQLVQTSGAQDAYAGTPLDLAGGFTSGQGTLAQHERGLLVPLGGATGLAGLVWLELGEPLDEAAQELLQAIADTAGMALEQALALAALA